MWSKTEGVFFSVPKGLIDLFLFVFFSGLFPWRFGSACLEIMTGEAESLTTAGINKLLTPGNPPVGDFLLHIGVSMWISLMPVSPWIFSWSTPMPWMRRIWTKTLNTTFVELNTILLEQLVHQQARLFHFNNKDVWEMSVFFKWEFSNISNWFVSNGGGGPESLGTCKQWFWDLWSANKVWKRRFHFLVKNGPLWGGHHSFIFFGGWWGWGPQHSGLRLGWQKGLASPRPIGRWHWPISHVDMKPVSMWPSCKLMLLWSLHSVNTWRGTAFCKFEI